MNEQLVEIAVPVRVDSTFHYLATSEIYHSVSLGSVVQIPFRSRTTYGFVLGFPNKAEVPREKLKSVESVLQPLPVFDGEYLAFMKWISEYYCHPLGEVIATAIPKPVWSANKKKKKSVAPKNATILPSQSRPTLNVEQSLAVEEISRLGDKRPVLLQGVTGSGKTEVYLAVLEKILALAKGAIILVPEIALTPQLLGRFSDRFPDLVCVLHSDLTPSERARHWERLQKGEAKVVIGPRSAIFAPVQNLGLIVVDEEHESSYKQEDSLRYHGRDVAVVRGALLGATVILGSATPSLESFQRAKDGKYRHIFLSKRVNERQMPRSTFIDIKNKENWFAPDSPWLSQQLVMRISQVLKNGQQTMLFLNRLGFAHFLFCSDCGHTWRCRNCDVALTYYQNPPALKCHYCAAHKEPPATCEVCQGMNLKTVGFGTEQVEKQIQSIFTTARVARMDRGALKHRKDLDELLRRISEREVDIIIGTQMMAKGHDFPGIALVGILMADASLNLPDFRAYEKTFQIITQVSGRAGRADVPGEVLIQTVNPEHPVLLAAAKNSIEEFYQRELESRRQHRFPPFGRMAMLRFQHSNLSRVEAFSIELVNFLRERGAGMGLKLDILGPSEAPLSRIKKLYRWQALVRSEKVADLQRALHLAIDFLNHNKNPIQMHVDVDPVHSL